MAISTYILDINIQVSTQAMTKVSNGLRYRHFNIPQSISYRDRDHQSNQDSISEPLILCM